MTSIKMATKNLQCEYYETATAEVQMFLNQFYLQLVHQPVVFTAAGFFDFDLPVLASMLTGVISYQIILLQFRTSSAE